MRSYGPIVGDLEWDGRSGEERSKSHSGRVLEADSRAACPFPDNRAQLWKALTSLLWPCPAEQRNPQAQRNVSTESP